MESTKPLGGRTYFLVSAPTNRALLNAIQHREDLAIPLLDRVAAEHGDEGVKASCWVLARQAAAVIRGDSDKHVVFQVTIFDDDADTATTQEKDVAHYAAALIGAAITGDVAGAEMLWGTLPETLHQAVQLDLLRRAAFLRRNGVVYQNATSVLPPSGGR
jgi:hypothetical protein